VKIKPSTSLFLEVQLFFQTVSRRLLSRTRVISSPKKIKKSNQDIFFPAKKSQNRKLKQLKQKTETVAKMN